MRPPAVLNPPSDLFVVLKTPPPTKYRRFFAQHISTPNPPLRFTFSSSYSYRKIRVSAVKKEKQIPELSTQKPEIENVSAQEEEAGDGIDLGWLPSFPHVLTASMSNFLFGYHIGYVEKAINHLNAITGWNPVSSHMQTVAKNRNMWVDNADRMVAGFLEMFEEGCHKMGTAIRDRIQEQLMVKDREDYVDEDDDEDYYDASTDEEYYDHNEDVKK